MSRSTTEHAAEIRATLKAKHGWSSRDVSVRADYFSLGSAIRVSIKNPKVVLASVKAIAEQAERISRCEITGEILGGGNRYVSISYTSEALKTLGEPYVAKVQAAVDSVVVGSNELGNVDGTEYTVGRPDGWRIQLWGENSHIRDHSTVEGVAEHIGELLLQAA